MAPLFSIVMPAYNESKNIAQAISDISNQLNASGYKFEIIVVDDGSIDDTYGVVNSLDKKNLKILRFKNNLGKGIALKYGLEHVKGDYVFFIDSDMEIKAKNINHYISALKIFDLVIASKRHPNSSYTAPFFRKFLSIAFQNLVRILDNVRASDTQSGLKAGRIEPLERIFKHLAVKRYAFDVELLTLAQLLKYRFVEMPVNIELNSWFSPVEAFRMFLDLLGIAYRLRITKWYQKRIQVRGSQFFDKP
jgi:glycosyltransferase involved in cell wall biosynthesis